MIYYFDSYYENQPFFQQQQVVGALAEFISRWAINYEGKLLAPRKGVLEKKCLGTLKGSESTKKVTVNKVIRWINENSESQNLFCLTLYGIDQDAKKDIALFSYEDSAHGWVLNLNPLQFKEMKEFLGTEGFPQDLFYPEECVVSQPFKLFGILPFGEKIYSSNQWRVLQELSKKS